MRDTSRRHTAHALAIVAAALTSACAAEAPLVPGAGSAPAAQPALAAAGAASGHGRGGVDLSGCEHLRAPAGSRPAARLYAAGVQIYRWNGTGWDFVAPAAELFADARASGSVGTHFAGPTWRSVSGGSVVGAVLERCPAAPGAIPWLLLSAVADGPGIFHGVTRIQRVNTVGGTAPLAPGSAVGEERRVPYTAEYYFYRPR